MTLPGDHGGRERDELAGVAPLPAAAYAAALATVPGIGPRALRTLLDAAGPAEAWRSVVAGRPGGGAQVARWTRAARQLDVTAIWAAHCRHGIDVRVLGEPGYPVALAADPEAPAVLFVLGDAGVVDLHPRVALVGTRTATRYGQQVRSGTA